jgi:hypothetical protein
MKSYICKCTNCNELYLDSNPEVNQRIYDIDDNSMDWLTSNHECPICHTMKYLVDVNEDIEEVYSHTIESIEIYKYRTINN